jgi:peptide/nickel transport system substrate-binding protein
MKVLDRAVVLSGLLVLALIGAALVGVPSGNPSSLLAPGDGTGARQVVLREGVLGQVRTLDPLFARNQAERDIDALLFRGLTRLGPAGAIVPDLARSWQVAPNGRVYTFYLRDDAVWHDGAPVTADDVVFTIRTLQHPQYTGAGGAPWSGVNVDRLDRLIVRFRLPSAPGGFLLLAAQPVVPSHLLAGTPIDQLETSGFGQQPVGSGPYRLESLGPAGAELVAAPAHRDVASAPANPLSGQGAASSGDPDSNVRPAVDRYRFRFFSDPSALVAAFRAREIDAVGGLPVETAASLLSDPGTRAIRYPRTVLTTVLLNIRPQQTTGFRDPRVRRALLMSIDRQRMLEELLRGRGRLAETPISPASFAYDAKAAGSVPYDPAGAARLLQAVGWKKVGGFWVRPPAKTPFVFELSALEPSANPLAHAVARQVVADWTTLGLQAQLKTYPRETLVEDKLLAGRYTSTVVDVNLGLDPDLYPVLGSAQALAGGTNLAGYQSRRMDALLQAARTYAPPATRKERFKTLQRSLATELPILPLFFGDYLFVVRSTLVGPSSREIAAPSDRYWDVLAWRLADGPPG